MKVAHTVGGGDTAPDRHPRSWPGGRPGRRASAAPGSIAAVPARTRPSRQTPRPRRHSIAAKLTFRAPATGATKRSRRRPFAEREARARWVKRPHGRRASRLPGRGRCATGRTRGRRGAPSRVRPRSPERATPAARRRGSGCGLRARGGRCVLGQEARRRVSGSAARSSVPVRGRSATTGRASSRTGSRSTSRSAGANCGPV